MVVSIQLILIIYLDVTDSQLMITELGICFSRFFIGDIVFKIIVSNLPGKHQWKLFM